MSFSKIILKLFSCNQHSQNWVKRKIRLIIKLVKFKNKSQKLFNSEICVQIKLMIILKCTNEIIWNNKDNWNKWNSANVGHALCFGCEEKYENVCDTFFHFGFPFDLLVKNMKKIKRTERILWNCQFGKLCSILDTSNQQIFYWDFKTCAMFKRAENWKILNKAFLKDYAGCAANAGFKILHNFP